jgi:hypothetical protein
MLKGADNHLNPAFFFFEQGAQALVFSLTLDGVIKPDGIASLFEMLGGVVEVNNGHLFDLRQLVSDFTCITLIFGGFIFLEFPLAELMLHGLLRASLIPAKPQRVLRELTRYRSVLVRERARVVNRVQKLLEGANIKLGNVVTDVMGVSARLMLEAIAAGSTNAEEMAELAKGRLRNKREALEGALTGLVGVHHRFILAKQLMHIDFLDEQIEALSEEIGRQLEEMAHSSKPDADSKPGGNESEGGEVEEEGGGLSWTEVVELLITIPGVERRTRR